MVSAGGYDARAAAAARNVRSESPRCEACITAASPFEGNCRAERLRAHKLQLSVGWQLPSSRASAHALAWRMPANADHRDGSPCRVEHADEGFSTVLFDAQVCRPRWDEGRTVRRCGVHRSASAKSGCTHCDPLVRCAASAPALVRSAQAASTCSLAAPSLPVAACV